ncbi:hypothetical protein GCM10022234_35820 [Aeromicrobium panaciterrae]
MSGTPPESLLAHPHVKQVAGDGYSRYFRPVGGDGKELKAEDGHTVEGYHWGQFTSGSWRAGLWLALVPFGLINAAQFMLPPFVSRTSKFWHGVCGALLRLAALLLTCLFAFTAGFVLMDLLGWRWAARTRLLRSYDPDTVLMVAVILSALAMVVMYALGKGFGRTGPSDSTEMDENTTTPLSKKSFYRGDADASTLRGLHLVAAFALIALMATVARNESAWDDRPFLAVAAFALLVVAAVVVTFLGDPEGSVSVAMPSRMARLRERWHAVTKVLSPLLVVISGIVVIAAAIRMNGTERPKPVGRIDAFDGVSNTLLVFGVAALVLMSIANLALAVTTRSTTTSAVAPSRFFARYAWGMTSYLVSTISMFIGVGLSAAVATAVSTSLNLDIAETITERGQTLRTRVGVTPILDRVAYAWGLNAFLMIGIAIFAVTFYFIRHKHFVAASEAMHAVPPEATTRLPDGWTSKIARGIWIGRLKTKLPALFWTFVVVGVILSLVTAWEIGFCVGGNDPTQCKEAPGFLDYLSQPRRTGNGDFLTIFGAWTLLALAGGMVALARGAIKTQSSRRGVSIIWDIVSFWPHAVHPFVPRPYSQRTVVDLRDRIRWHLSTIAESDVNRPVVVCGHSQGSLISFGALMLLRQEERDRVALLTFGSQLRMIFPRAFPGFVNLESIAGLYDGLNGAWINLYRATDPLAGPVLSWDHSADGAEPSSQHFPDLGAGRQPDAYDPLTRRRISGADWRIIDPTPYDAALQTGPVTRLRGHSDFWDDASWPTALAAVVDVPPRSGS